MAHENQVGGERQLAGAVEPDEIGCDQHPVDSLRFEKAKALGKLLGGSAEIRQVEGLPPHRFPAADHRIATTQHSLAELVEGRIDEIVVILDEITAAAGKRLGHRFQVFDGSAAGLQCGRQQRSLIDRKFFPDPGDAAGRSAVAGQQ